MATYHSKAPPPRPASRHLKPTKSSPQLKKMYNISAMFKKYPARPKKTVTVKESKPSKAKQPSRLRILASQSQDYEPLIRLKHSQKNEISGATTAYSRELHHLASSALHTVRCNLLTRIHDARPPTTRQAQQPAQQPKSIPPLPPITTKTPPSTIRSRDLLASFTALQLEVLKPLADESIATSPSREVSLGNLMQQFEARIDAEEKKLSRLEQKYQEVQRQIADVVRDALESESCEANGESEEEGEVEPADASEEEGRVTRASTKAKGKEREGQEPVEMGPERRASKESRYTLQMRNANLELKMKRDKILQRLEADCEETLERMEAVEAEHENRRKDQQQNFMKYIETQM